MTASRPDCVLRVGISVLGAILIHCSSQAACGADAAGAPRTEHKWRMVPVYEASYEGTEKLALAETLAAEGRTITNAPVFYAVSAREWLPGLVPLFAIEKAGQFELRRRPRRAHESFSEPLIFALPLPSEPDAPVIAGHWSIDGVRGDGSKVYLGWELSYEDGQVAGRFDQGGEYRWASIVGGTFRSNRIDLRVEYIADAYAISGGLKGGELTGTWQHLKATEQGQWKAVRDAAPIQPRGRTSPLFEWTSGAGTRKRYAPAETRLGEGWSRSAQPLALVWIAPE
jgi:hypothetical protein